MNKRGHLATGFTVGILFIVITNIWLGWFSKEINSIAIYGGVIFIYSLLADTDHRNSFISFLFIGASILGLIVGYNYKNNIVMYSAFGLLIITFIAWIIGHRGFVHSITFGILVSVPLLYFFSYQVALLGFICFYSHLVADSEYFKLF